MSGLYFLQRCLPTLGQNEYYPIIGRPKGDGYFKTYFCGTIREAADTAIKLSDRGFNAYYVVSSVNNPVRRRKEDCVAEREFGFDLDFKPDDNHYHDLAAARDAVWDFTNQRALKSPMFVDTGGGVHVHWPLVHGLYKEEYIILARGLKEALYRAGIKFDKCTLGSPTQLLRVPGTLNHKYDPPRMVTVIDEGDGDSLPDAFEQFRALGEAARVERVYAVQGLWKVPGTVESLLSHCAVARWQDNDGGQGLPYEPWRGLATVAITLEGGEEWYHESSKKHPDYDPHKTQQKLDDAFDWLNSKEANTGPMTCKKFAESCGVCNDCPFFHHGSSPAMFAKWEPVEEPNEQEVMEDVQPEVEPANVPSVIQINGGTAAHSGSFAVEGQAPVEGDYEAVYRVDANGTKIYVDYDTLVDSDKLTKKTQAKGVIVTVEKSKWKAAILINMATTMTNKLPMVAKSMGWTDDFSAYKYGLFHITPNGIIYAPPITEIEPLVKDIRPNGAATKDGWFQQPKWIEAGFKEHRKLLQTFFAPGLEHQAVMLISSVAQLIYPVYEQEYGGIVLSMFGKESGTGKTTLLHASLGMWCAPSALMLMTNSSSNQHQEKMAMLRHLPVGIDEPHKNDLQRVNSDLQAFTTGRPRERLDQGGHMVVRTGSWNTHMFLASNKSTLELLRQRPDTAPMGERVVEVYYPGLPFSPNVGLLKGLKDKSGFVIVWLITQLLRQPGLLDEIREAIGSEVNSLYATEEFLPQHRIKVIHLATWKVAARMVKELGIFVFDEEALARWYTDVITANADTLRPDDIVTVTNNFWQFNRAKIWNPKRGPLPDNISAIGSVNVDEKVVYLAYAPWRDYIQKQGFNPFEALHELHRRGKAKSKGIIQVGLHQLNDGATPMIDCIAYIPAEDELTNITNGRP